MSDKVDALVIFGATGDLAKIETFPALVGLVKRGVLNLTADQASILMAAANSTGGVMGKMIDAQSIVVSAAATQQPG